jgi:ribosomal protein L6P/L9E
MVGLGYKNFVLNDSLFVLVGDCNYLIFQIPQGIKILCRKNQIYLVTNNSAVSGDFAAKLKGVKRLNMYKGKGVLEFRNFKFTRLKIGKKQKV